MPVAYPIHGTLAVNMRPASGLMQLLGAGAGSVASDILVALAAPAHAFATIYTTQGSERVILTGEGAGIHTGKLTLVRAVEGTELGSWPAGSCVKIDTPIPGRVPNAPTNASPTFDIKNALCLGVGLRWNTDVTGASCLELAPTGVVPTNMCGATVDTAGRFTSIPDNWPAICVPIFDPCCNNKASVTEGGTVKLVDTVSAANLSLHSTIPPNSVVTFAALNAWKAALGL